MTLKLPINFDTVYGGMCRDRNRIIAVMSSDKKLPWLFNNFIPLVMYGSYNVHNYDTSNYYEVFDIYDQVIDLQLFEIGEVKDIQNALESNCYIIACWDRYFIRGTPEYLKDHLIHEVLIYGYDSENRLLYFHDSAINGKEYDVGIISVDSFFEAIGNINKTIYSKESTQWQIAFGHPFSKFSIKNNNIDINLRKIFFDFYNNYQGKKIDLHKSSESQQFYYGLNIFEGLHNILEEIKDGVFDASSKINAVWSIKLLSRYMENNVQRFYYLMDKGWIEWQGELLESYKRLSIDLLVLFNLINKIIFKRKSKDIFQAYELLECTKKNYTANLLLTIKLISKSLRKEINL